ncbi:hypothetical protein PF011_g8743 [Phytophthora fragariae]|uniref:SWIM-type domain-containing protein n=1 Tax=Phytophthora fragariae TaxID=53985 RepID=A0A6A3L9Q3_9STRA|nr:hypothetical protein PF011_g8743 [Phytophthora fragariae]
MAETAGQLWEAPTMERHEFISWDEFFAYMEDYQQRTHQSFSRRSATSVKTRNQVLASMAKSGRPIPSPLLPESFLDYTRMLQCSHKLRGDAVQAHARWNGEQPSECQARVNATLQVGDYGKFYIRVTKVSLLHNHPVGGDAKPVYAATVHTPTSAATGGQEDPSLVAKRRRVDAQRKPEERQEDASSHAARQATKDAQRVPTMADVRMFLERVEITRPSQAGAGQSVEERLAAYVNEFAAQSGNAAKIFVDSDKVLSSVTLQTKHMRKVFEAFPEVLRVDSMPPTKGSSDSSYRVFSLMAHDTLGQWQYVQHAIVENDRSETLRVALDQFKAHNARHPRVRALIVPSEDSAQLKELRASFPPARVLYSQFHVLRALHKVIAEDGNDLSSWHRDRLTGIAQLLVYAPTSLVYAANIAVMVDVLGSKQHTFFRYFIEKWDVCRDRWSTFAREGVTTFSMSENDGPYAPTWNAIFAAVNDEMALDETVAAIRYYQTVVERAFVRDLSFHVNNPSIQHRIVSSNNGDDYDAEMRLLSATVSPAASSLIFPQYRYATSRGAYQFCEPSRGSFFISTVSPNDAFCDEPSKEFCVEVDRGWQCSCAFMVNHHLPCRHVFYIRRIVRCSTVIPLEHIEYRWVLAKAKDYFNSSQISGFDSGLEAECSHTTVPPPGAWQKFVTAQEVGKRIGYRMMDMGPEEFDRALRFYKLVETTLSVRPFDLNAGTVARLNSQNGGVGRPAVHKPNWVEPDPTRTLAPRSGPPAVAGTVYVSSNDRMAAAVAARNMQQAQHAQRFRRASAMKATREVIDLQDESEEEEKRGSLQENEPERRPEPAQPETRTDNNAEPSQEDPTADQLSDNQETEELANNQDEEGPEQDPSSADEAAHTSPRARERWEVIDELEKDDDEEDDNDRLL